MPEKLPVIHAFYAKGDPRDLRALQRYVRTAPITEVQ